MKKKTKEKRRRRSNSLPKGKDKSFCDRGVSTGVDSDNILKLRMNSFHRKPPPTTLCIYDALPPLTGSRLGRIRKIRNTALSMAHPERIQSFYFDKINDSGKYKEMYSKIGGNVLTNLLALRSCVLFYVRNEKSVGENLITDKEIPLLKHLIEEIYRNKSGIFDLSSTKNNEKQMGLKLKISISDLGVDQEIFENCGFSTSLKFENNNISNLNHLLSYASKKIKTFCTSQNEKMLSDLAGEKSSVVIIENKPRPTIIYEINIPLVAEKSNNEKKSSSSSSFLSFLVVHVGKSHLESVEDIAIRKIHTTNYRDEDIKSRDLEVRQFQDSTLRRLCGSRNNNNHLFSVIVLCHVFQDRHYNHNRMILQIGSRIREYGQKKRMVNFNFATDHQYFYPDRIQKLVDFGLYEDHEKYMTKSNIRNDNVNDDEKSITQKVVEEEETEGEGEQEEDEKKKVISQKQEIDSLKEEKEELNEIVLRTIPNMLSLIQKLKMEQEAERKKSKRISSQLQQQQQQVKMEEEVKKMRRKEEEEEEERNLMELKKKIRSECEEKLKKAHQLKINRLIVASQNTHHKLLKSSSLLKTERDKVVQLSKEIELLKQQQLLQKQKHRKQQKQKQQEVSIIQQQKQQQEEGEKKKEEEEEEELFTRDQFRKLAEKMKEKFVSMLKKTASKNKSLEKKLKIRELSYSKQTNVLTQKLMIFQKDLQKQKQKLEIRESQTQLLEKKNEKLESDNSDLVSLTRSLESKIRDLEREVVSIRHDSSRKSAESQTEIKQEQQQQQQQHDKKKKDNIKKKSRLLERYRSDNLKRVDSSPLIIRKRTNILKKQKRRSTSATSLKKKVISKERSYSTISRLSTPPSSVLTRTKRTRKKKKHTPITPASPASPTKNMIMMVMNMEGNNNYKNNHPNPHHHRLYNVVDEKSKRNGIRDFFKRKKKKSTRRKKKSSGSSARKRRSMRIRRNINFETL